MRHRRDRILEALVALLALSAPACSNLAGPRARFLDGWIEEHAPSWSVSSRRGVVKALLHAESETGTDAFLLLAVVEEESRYDPSARSRKGARGLMQLLPSTAGEVGAGAGIAWSGAQDLNLPSKNVRIGAVYLTDLKRRFGSWETALAAYHAGPTRIRAIERRGGRVPTKYASRVLRRHRLIRQAYSDGKS